ncbi:chemotaxis protein CheB [Burkholderia gladioli]|uniref:chemotaxis protein CheB n=1 Tax=Burkholderia gladioli TaxID=28095 RepID=UPI00163FF922|nr:chemotaxis protein CheB [Burkholderia gladioli]
MPSLLDTEHRTRRFPMVGIGASAGGLEAISEFISALPFPCGMAFLVVQHLDPSRPSLLADILGNHTAMPVVEATEGLTVDPDQLYVIPPNTRMSIEQGRVKLHPRGQPLGPPMPVDDLLESLARDRGADAIGVILSGSGSDGALGLQTLQNEGGITFAQDLDSARFTGMPQAAIHLGCVDFVLAPARIAEAIVGIGRQRQSDADTVERESEPENNLRPIFRLLQKTCDIDFTHYKRGTIERRLARRMALRQVQSVADYTAELDGDPAEVLALGRDLLIRVTSFFRDAESFDALTQTVFPRILADRETDMPIRIWVAGCSTGEEVYSIAICLVEYLGEQANDIPIQIFGTDVSVDALEVARAGRYIENIARNVSVERLQRFFVREDDYYRVDKSLRDLCTFARHNVFTDPPFSRIDLLSCRNLLIYLDSILQRSVMPLFHYALTPNRILMLGPSETVGGFSDLFGVIESRRTRLYSKRARSMLSVAKFATTVAGPPRTRQSRELAGSRREPAGTEPLRRVADRCALARYVPPSVLCDDALNIVEYRGDTASYLGNPSGPPSTHLQRLAKPAVFLSIVDAVKRVREDGVAVRKTGVHLDTPHGVRNVNLEVHPIQAGNTEGRWFLIFFESPAPLAAFLPAVRRESIRGWMARALPGSAKLGAREKDAEIARLRAELDASREQLRATLEEHESAREELKSSEEELLSSNEEFQSANEELETAKEELQSVNEELSTTNDELRYRIRELRELHEEITRARDYADAIIETISEPLLVLESDLRVARANRAFYQTFDTAAEDTLGIRLFDLGRGQWHIPALRALLEELLPEQLAIRDYRITHEFPHVGVRTLRLNAARVAWPARMLILLTIDDVTKQHQALEQLQAADHQKDEFLAMLAHELRNPLATIRNGLQIWQSGAAQAETTRETQATMQRQLDHEIALVDDLLDVSRITRGIIRLHSQPIDLLEAVHDALDGMRSEATARGHTLTVVLPDHPVTIDADRMRIEQIITNLLGNAVKYTPEGGRIRLSVVHESRDVVLTVSDNGIGMAASFIPTIFNVFVQAERSLDRRSAGLGLGLALVRRLVELHRGSVNAFSDGLGKGSRFVVRLPALATEVSPVGDEVEHALGAAGTSTSFRILVVEDNVDAAESTSLLLTISGHTTRISRDGPSALQQIDDFRPEVVLLDIGLPNMDGYEIARRIRAMQGQVDTVLIALSGYGQAEDLRRSQEAGFDHHLVKPADIANFGKLIDSCKRARADNRSRP